MPVTFATIAAQVQGDANQVVFETENEENNAYFTVERSVDQRQWEAIGQITGTGTTQERQYYSSVSYTHLTLPTIA